MTKNGLEGLDIIFSMYGTTSKNFGKIWAPLPQMCSVLSEYSQQLVPLFSPLNLGESGFQIKVLVSAHQEDSKTPPGNLILSKTE